MDARELEPGETDPDHPCTDVALYDGDRAMLAYLLQDLRSLARQLWIAPASVTPYSTIEWSVHGLRRRIVVCDPARLRTPDDVCTVGFFGERRAGAATDRVDEFEVELMAEFAHYPGILSYSSMELVDDQWANLVVHADRQDTEYWRRSQVHSRAVLEVSPVLFHSVRIHNGVLNGGPIGTSQVVVERTKYWDYGDDPTAEAWRAQRTIVT